MRQTEFCNHYRAMSDHDTCKKDISYSTFEGLPYDQRPCFERDGVAPSGCPFAEFPTAEEREERELEITASMVKIGNARRAIVDHLGGPWKKGMATAAGAIDCPVCDGKDSLGFSRAGYNGHIHAACDTEGCVRWME